MKEAEMRPAAPPNNTNPVTKFKKPSYNEK